ncbi:transglycosylase domain-containing protein [Corynebacterium sp. 335C]
MERVNTGRHLAALVAATVVGGLLVALALFPVVGGTGAVLARTSDELASSTESITSGRAPGVTTINDASGKPMAWLYEQRRFPVPSDRISPAMKDAIVAIEDRRFWEHSGVDWKGTARAALTNFTAGSVQQGASTIEQQLIKNHAFLVEAENEAERRAAVATDYGRKLREIRLAQDLEGRMSKDQILAAYLNLVPFGNGAFGIEAAAQTYFGIPAADLTVAQSALLAGMVQQTSGLNPYTNPEGARARRDDVLNAMADVGAVSHAEADAAKATELGVLPQPNILPEGCIAAGDNGFFCDYVIQWLEGHGLPAEELTRGTYTVNTTLDPEVQASAEAALEKNASPTADGVAEVMNVVQPGEDSRRVLAMASSRHYGLDPAAGQTVQPQPYTMVGNGAGSVFKVFAAAAAVERGMGIDTTLQVPRRYEAQGLGDGGAEGCPAGMYCVENVTSYKPSMTLSEALAHSPNTTFVMLAEQLGVPAIADMAVRLGLRSYAEPGTWDADTSIKDYVSEATLGSFVLGPTPINALELSNVGATLASKGRWCEPSPVDAVLDHAGNPVELDLKPCEDAMDPGAASAVANAMGLDHVEGTAEGAAEAAGWSGPMAGKTGTTESHQSAAFLGFTSGLSSAVYAYNDGPTTSELCTSPLRQCGSGDLYGGREPARTWYDAVNPVIGRFDGATLPEMDPKYRSNHTAIPYVAGLKEDEARKKLEEAGFKVTTTTASGTGRPAGEVTGVTNANTVLKGGLVVIAVSDGSRPAPPPPPAPAPGPAPAPDEAPRPDNPSNNEPPPVAPLPDSIDIPGIGTIPLPG